MAGEGRERHRRADPHGIAIPPDRVEIVDSREVDQIRGCAEATPKIDQKIGSSCDKTGRKKTKL